jgi:Cu2+-exporting ATPase
LTLIAITAGVVTLVIWLFAGKDFVFALSRTATVMVITCPHALGLAVPLVVKLSGRERGRKQDETGGHGIEALAGARIR